MIDYRKLLLKYMNHVGLEEGSVYLGFKQEYFTDEEWIELKVLEEESCPEVHW